MQHGVWEPVPRVYDPLKSGSIDGTDAVPHDRAITRAANSVYVPCSRTTGEARKTLFVGKLSADTDEVRLKKVFRDYGSVECCRVVREPVTMESKRYGFVTFYEERDCREARAQCNHLEVDGNKIFVEFENCRTMPGWIPRRLGGGLGGRKESGQLRFGGRDRPFKQPILLNGQQPKLIRSFDELKQYPENQECHIPSRDKRRWPSRERERSKSMEKKRSPSRNRKHSKRDDERSQSVRSERHKEKRRVRESSRRSRSVSVEKERRHKSKHKKRRR